MPVRIKASSESRTNTVVGTADSDLTVSLAASTTYFIDAMMIFEAGATPDIKFALRYNGTLTSAVMACHIGNSRDDRVSTGSSDHRTIFFNAGNLTTPVTFVLQGNDTAETAGVCNYRGVVRTNSASTLELLWAQNTTSGTATTVLDGSYIRYDTQADLPGTLIVKTSTTSRASNTTATADPDLQFATAANGQYLAELGITVTCGSGTTGFKKRLSDTGITDAVGYIVQMRGTTAGSETSSATGNTSSSFRTAMIDTPDEDSPTAVAGLPRWLAIMWSQIEDNATSTLAFDWAQRVSNVSATSVNTPSWLWYEEV